MLSINVVLAAFGGGLFGALIGSIASFIFVGIVGIVGIAVLVSAGDPTILADVAFGPFFGPHIGFAGGVAAAAFAAKKGHLPTGNAVLNPLVSSGDPMVLIVGGVFGVFGLFAQYLFGSVLKFNMDTVALTVVLSGVIARLAFGKSGLFGSKGFGAERYATTGKELCFGVLTAISLGFVVGYSVIKTGVPELGFVISAISLLFLFTNPGGGPVTHHITWPAGVAAAQTGSIYYAALAALIGYLMFTFVGVKTLNNDTDTHIDSPATAISITTLIVMNLFPKL